VTPISRKAAIRRVLDAWRAGGYQDTASAAASIVAAHASGQKVIDAIPDEFCARNNCDAAEAAERASQALNDIEIERERDRLIFPEDIDSFSRIAEVSRDDIAKIPLPLSFLEAEVKRLLLEILSEKVIPGDWGGERSDAFNTNVIFDGRRIPTSFVLKGRSKSGVLVPADYGKNGDQIGRSFTQPADLHIIQTNAELDSSVHEEVQAFVAKARADGRPNAMASLWNGSDTARILVAYGKIDRADGAPLV
jgi:hypothetical protein